MSIDVSSSDISPSSRNDGVEIGNLEGLKVFLSYRNPPLTPLLFCFVLLIVLVVLVLVIIVYSYSDHSWWSVVLSSLILGRGMTMERRSLDTRSRFCWILNPMFLGPT